MKSRFFGAFSALLCVVLVFALALPAAAATAKPALTVSAPQSASPGERVSVYLDLTDPDDLAVLDFDLYYDASVLTLNSTTVNSALTRSVNTNTAGLVRASVMKMDGIQDDIRVMTLSFSVASDAPAGETPLTLAIGDAYRADLSAITVRGVSGAITVRECAPKITSQPQSVTANAGETAQFTVQATGSSLSYRWQFRAPGTSTWYDSGMTGAKTATISVPATAARNGQQYRCVVSNAMGRATSSAATLSTAAVVKPQVVSQPKNVSAAAGESVRFTVQAAGGDLTYQWQFRAPGTTTWYDSGMTGAQTATISVPATHARSGQQYRCVVSNDLGSATSSAATLNVLAKPAITAQPQSVAAAYGDAAKFTVSATGGDLSYQWQYKSAGSSAWRDSGMEGAQTATLTVPATAARNGQQYRCVVTNSEGTVTSDAAKLTVK